MAIIGKAIVVILMLIILISTISPTVISDFNDDEIDQQQTIEESYLDFYKANWLSQSFKPTKGNLTRIQLKLAKIGDISTDLTVGIKTLLINPDIITKSINASNISTEKQWIEVNFTDTFLDLSTTYFIVCRTNGGDENNSYTWYQSNTDTYENGSKYLSFTNGQNWFEDNSSDFCFKTFGNERTIISNLDITYIKGVALGFAINYGIKNTGKAEIEDIKILMNISDGLVFPRSKSFELPRLNPDQEARLSFYPIFGYGHATITICVWAKNIEKVEKQRDALFYIIGIYVHPSWYFVKK
jgi:hypothetical protein